MAAALIKNLSERFPSLQELKVKYTITSRAKDTLAEGVATALNTSSLRVLHLECNGPVAAMAAAVGQIAPQHGGAAAGEHHEERWRGGLRRSFAAPRHLQLEETQSLFAREGKF